MQCTWTSARARVSLFAHVKTKHVRGNLKETTVIAGNRFRPRGNWPAIRDQWAGFYKPKTLRTLSHAPWHNPTFVTCSLDPTLPFKLIPKKKKKKLTQKEKRKRKEKKKKKQYSSIFSFFHYSFINSFGPSPFIQATTNNLVSTLISNICLCIFKFVII